MTPGTREYGLALSAKQEQLDADFEIRRRTRMAEIQPVKVPVEIELREVLISKARYAELLKIERKFKRQTRIPRSEFDELVRKANAYDSQSMEG